ncbi:alpha/beta hydrolase-fold protein [Tsukamurella sp. 8F]|uniref:alpha/beta hydrolase n=1 Tax=unclassified Tsukamurella TaxID=2633480 RepID=UPI0023BA22D2|nr:MULTISPECIES: alpha/beta hydrolase-fold protein [unclassified Tsukamurella]MDF0528638.1 alpha/beta hydrolase-fold protein [Tsukamurella sp. 8J]MDF0585600.1 alpha/beta hydrolase-fold protein [Tsukamurella sp. 8F]
MDGYRGGVSLLTGWLPTTVFIIAALLVIAALFRRRARWYLIALPICAVVGVVCALAARTYMDSEGLAGDPAPFWLWLWIGAAGAALAAWILRLRRGGWVGRTVPLLGVVSALVAAVLVVNQWVGYYRTVQVAWASLSAGPLPGQTDPDQLSSLRDTKQTAGRVVPVDIPDEASGFKHRTEYVYLPPAWFAGKNPPALPALEMIGGEFNTPADWIRLGNATSAADKYAQAHDGVAPIEVFVDSGGSFNNDTECVDGPRGNSASHLTKDVRPYVVNNFGARSDAASWGIIGWSMGGTCAMDLTVTHPDLFSSFVDIGGDLGPSSGTKAQTISRLFGGNAAQWNAYDPMTVMAEHGKYAGVSGLFVDADGRRQGGRGHKWKFPKGGFHRPQPQNQAPAGFGGNGGDDFADPGAKGSSQKLCTAMKGVDIDCSIDSVGDGHTWQSATKALTVALPVIGAKVGVT